MQHRTTLYAEGCGATHHSRCSCGWRFPEDPDRILADANEDPGRGYTLEEIIEATQIHAREDGTEWLSELEERLELYLSELLPEYGLSAKVDLSHFLELSSSRVELQLVITGFRNEPLQLEEQGS